MRTDVLGVAFDDVTLEEAVDRGMALLDEEGPHLVATPNPEIVQIAGKTRSLPGYWRTRRWCWRTAWGSSTRRRFWAGR